jgi:hypothetical protein
MISEASMVIDEDKETQYGSKKWQMAAEMKGI